jgi:hypothetical protein
MLEISNELLDASFGEALETMAFITPLPPDDPAAAVPPAGSTLVLTRIEYRGVQCGALELLCPRRLGAMLAANLMGCEPDDPEADGRAADALREVVNITCGTMLRNSGVTASGVVEMTVPAQRELPAAGWDAFAKSAGASVFDADGCFVALRRVELE